MLTVDADQHPLMRRMHKPKPKLLADHRDKRGVIPIPLADTDEWLGRTARDAATFFKLPAAELFAVAQG